MGKAVNLFYATSSKVKWYYAVCYVIASIPRKLLIFDAKRVLDPQTKFWFITTYRENYE